MRLKKLRLASAASLAAICAAPALAAPTVTLTEAMDAFGNGNYTISIDSEPLDARFIAAFAVENDTASSASTDYNNFNSGGSWSAMLIDAATWDNCDSQSQTCSGYDVSYSTPGGQQVLFNTFALGSFESVFGSDASQAALYWAANYIQYSDINGDLEPEGLIGPDETASEFYFSAAILASNYVVISSNGAELARGDIDDNVVETPEPAAMGLLGPGLVALGLRRARRA